MAALVCGLSLSVTSCKDDNKDDNESNGGNTDQELVQDATDTDEAMAAYSWLTNMASVEEFTDDWASKTYEPTIGVESQNQANTRIVVVANMDYAKMNFASISGMSISALSATQSQTIDGVGTITWTPSAEGASNLATVDVNTKLIPHLTKIVYCTAEQVGDNGSSFDGTAYYRFGDVIEDRDGYYWVCVKPAFGTGKSAQKQGYWINIINRDPVNGKSTLTGKVPPIPTKNIKSKWNKDKAYNYNTILLPTALNSTKDQVHNLSNLVWALLDPQAYQEAVGADNIGLGSYEYKYNGKMFCDRVAQKWKELGIWEKLFNRSYDQMKQMKKLNFFYEGYRWHLGMGNVGKVTLQTTDQFSTTYLSTLDEDQNHRVELGEKGAGFDIGRYCSDPEQDASCASSGKAGYAPARQFTATEGYWVVRQKTSKELAGTFSTPDVYNNITNTSDTYNYNQSYGKAPGSFFTVEEEDSYKNRCFYSIGDVVKDKNNGKWFCVQASPYNTDYGSEENNYAYFVSYSRKAVGEKMKNIPASKELAAQMLFALQSWFNFGTGKINDPEAVFSRIVENVKKNTGVNWYDLFLERDTVCQTTLGKRTAHCDFGSTVYRDADGKICVLRLIYDDTRENPSGGGRNFEWNFWDSYTSDPQQTMMYADLADTVKIKKYTADKWVNLPWYNPKTQEQYLDERMAKHYVPNKHVINFDDCIYDKAIHGLYEYLNLIAITNAYYEPLIAFTVKRVKDTGYSSTAFEDGTAYTHVSLARDYLSDFAELVEDQFYQYGLSRLFTYYAYQNGGINLNGKPYDFKINNKP